MFSQPERAGNVPFVKRASKCINGNGLLHAASLAIGVVFAKRADPFIQELADLVNSNLSRMRGELARSWGAKPKMHHNWLSNQNTIQDTVKRERDLCRIRDPIRVSPLPRWIKSWPGAGQLDHGYQVPAREDVVRAASMINIWSSYWPETLQKDVSTWATRVRESSPLASLPSEALQPKRHRIGCR